jgi:ParB family chromosome partitioning protein
LSHDRGPPHMAVGREHAPLDHLKGGVEWFTPRPWVERVRTAMRSIDCDPTSCAHAQRVVKAAEWFEQKRSGLDQTWRGNVFLNPPYTRGVIDKFVDKLVAERANFTQAIVLVDNRSDAAWFHRLCGIASAVALPKRRIGFYSDDPDARAPSVWGSAFIYVGDRRDAFAAAFAGSCMVLQPVDGGA